MLSRVNTTKFVYLQNRGIPDDIIEYFDKINPEQLMFGAQEFTCEECVTGIIRSEKEPEIIIRGYGLYSGFGDN